LKKQTEIKIMNNQLQTTKPKGVLPKLEDLYSDLSVAAKQNDLNKLLNADPKPEWIKTNQFAGNSKYIPIEIIEYLLTSIYIKWKVEIKSVQVIANSVTITVRLLYMDPITGEWDWQEGVGASPIQTAKGAAATDFSKVNTAAVQMAAPAAETYAIKDAAEKLGRIFGKDINRQAVMNYSDALNRKFTEVGVMPDELREVMKEADKENLLNIYESNPDLHGNKEFTTLFNNRIKELHASRNGQPVKG
jgi:hypothetical protein